MKVSAFMLTAALALSVSGESAKVYPHYMDPRKHPDDTRRTVKPPSRSELGDRMHFMALRWLNPGNYKDDFDLYCKKDNLGDFIWSYWTVLNYANMREIAREMKRRGLYLFDIVGFEPGRWPQYQGLVQIRMPKELSQMLEEELGDHWLGMDNGEQDGRYSAVFGSGIYPSIGDTLQAYYNFQRHFEYMDELQGNKMAALVSLNFGHYFLKENCYTFLGAETAQGLPNGQVYYSFIRGAGKQYGVPWFGNVSVFSRWGWKDYGAKPPHTKDKGPSPTNGASLALLKKLMFAQIFYNSGAVGFEMGYYMTDPATKEKVLTPIGQVQKDAVAWYGKHGDPGVHYAPVAVMCDFFAGWTFPRQRYAGGSPWQCWGSVTPYTKGDHFTDGVIGELYPQYRESAYIRDETGYNSDTPYGDFADCLLSDAPGWLLRRYAVVVLTSKVTPSAELADTLRAYAEEGGHLVMTEANAKILYPEGFGAAKKGKVTVLPGEGVYETPQCAKPYKYLKEGEVMSVPYPLLPEAKKALDGIFREQMIFGASKEPAVNGLSIITCRRGKGEYTVAVLNNTWKEQPFGIYANKGKITRTEELPIGTAERKAVGYWPGCFDTLDVGTDTASTIAAGAVRTFRVWLDEGAEIAEIPDVAPPPRPTGVTLYLRNVSGPIKEEILRRPTFFRHFDSVMLDASYLLSRDREDLKEQTGFLGKQQLKVMVDLSPFLNMYPGIRLVDNDPAETARSQKKIADLLDKMGILGAKDLVLTRHQMPLTHTPGLVPKDAFVAGVKKLCQDAAKKDVTVYFRTYAKRYTMMIDDATNFVAQVAEPNFKPALSFATETHRTGGKADFAGYQIVNAKAPLAFLALPGGGSLSLHEPLTQDGRFETRVPEKEVWTGLRRLKQAGIPVVFEAVYPDPDAEYRDVRLWESAK